MPSPKEFQPYRTVQANVDNLVRSDLERAARDIRRRISLLKFKPGIGAQVRTAQLALVLRQISHAIDVLWRVNVAGHTQTGRKAAAQAAEDVTQALTRVAYSALTPDAAQALSDGFTATARAGINAAFARVPRDLSSRVYTNAAVTRRWVETTIRSGIVSGLSAKELSQDVYKYISPTTPGGASYAAMRLARTEINNAFHEQQKAGGNRPGVQATKWNLSESHPKKDECNVYADHPSGLGKGCYAFGHVPDKPHPQCFCYLTYVMMPPVDFRAALTRGDFDAEINRRTKLNLERLKQRDSI